MFSNEQIDKNLIESTLRSVFSNRLFYEDTKAKWGIFCYIDKIKVDIVNYPYPLIAEIETVDSIRFYSDKDLMAMKIQAILGRGKKKDFWDIAELLNHYSIEEMMVCHKAKYPSQMLGISIPTALLYFDDADNSEEPQTIKPMTWNKVKSIIKEKVRDFLK